MSSQPPPQATEAEEAVLGAILMSKHAIAAVGDEITPDDFYMESNKLIYRAALSLDQSGQAVDPITLIAELDRYNALERVGGRARIQQLLAQTPAASNAGHHARLIREAAIMRRLVQAGGAIAQLGWNGNGQADDLLAMAEQHLSEVSFGLRQTHDFELLSTSLDDLIVDIDDTARSGVPAFGTRTGFPDLDRITTGLHPGELVLLAARPSMGKSMLAQNVIENLCDTGGAAALFTMEMSRRDVNIRALGRATSINPTHLRIGPLKAEELQKVHVAGQTIKGRRFYVEDEPNISLNELRARARRLQRKEGLDLLVVDYLQLMLTKSGADTRATEVGMLSRGLKVLARELAIPVIAVSQLNRDLESRPDKRPRLSDLRESGALEQDADLVLFIYRDEYYNPDSDAAGVAEIICAKNRMGPTDTTKLAFSGKRSSFLNLAREH
jgi:replicative DNA helicase